MAQTRIRLSSNAIRQVDWAALRRELHIVEPFSEEAQRESQAGHKVQGVPLDLPFFTVDPPDSMDLDQAMYLERMPDGYRVHYAIADVAAFVAPGGALDAETHTRCETFYSPDVPVPLHPFAISEDAASLLPNQLRSAVVWQMELDADANLKSATVQRATVMSKQRFDYETVETAGDQYNLLKQIGEMRRTIGQARGAIDLGTSEQLVTTSPEGNAHLAYRSSLPSERWNEQISLLTGLAAAQKMLDAKVGLLRTLPPANADVVAGLRLSAIALGIDWPEDKTASVVISALDSAKPSHAALLTLATKLLRGAAYTAFDGELPTQADHAGVGGPYAHCTAPLRRLADRYVNEICLALDAGIAIPQWARDALTALPAEMLSADRRAHSLERAIVDAAEALALQDSVGSVFDAVVVETDAKGGQVQLKEPAVRARCAGVAQLLGQSVKVRLTEVDVVARTVQFALAEDSAA